MYIKYNNNWNIRDDKIIIENDLKLFYSTGAQDSIVIKKNSLGSNNKNNNDQWDLYNITRWRRNLRTT